MPKKRKNKSKGTKVPRAKTPKKTSPPKPKSTPRIEPASSTSDTLAVRVSIDSQPLPGAGAPENAELPEIAFYYPNPYWQNADWAKNLILFFDGIGMLIPNYMPNSSHGDDEAVIEGLRQHNLFHVFEPESFLDKDAAKRLTDAVKAIIDSGALDKLTADESGSFAELSMSRMGFHVAEECAKEIFDELKKRKLAKDSADGVSIPMHKSVRYVILILLSQILRANGRKAGFELLPATDVPQLVGALTELLGQPAMPSADRVVSLDMQAVGVDLGSVPIDEVLSFRAENRDAYKKYARNLRLCIHDLSLMSSQDQESRLAERQDEITSLASDIRKTARKAWKKPATFLLSAAGAVWRAHKGDVIGASIAGGAAILSLGKPEKVDTGAYSYLFSARNRYW